jgi:predicted acetyltransferase
MSVTVEVAQEARKPVFANLMQLYIHDFSEQWAGRPDGELQEDGLFAPYLFLDAYWTEPGRTPFLVRADGALAGFALVNTVGHSGAPTDWNMAEFFVARKHRRAGVGLVAAHQVFTRFPGAWEVAVARTNTGALPFWRRAAGSLATAGDIEEIDLATGDWNGPILRFKVR